MRRKVRTSNFISTVSIALVLFLLASVSYLIISAMSATDRMKENITVHVMLKGGMKQDQIGGVKDRLLARQDIKEVIYVSKEEAAAEYIESTGDDFSEFIDFNPLPDSYQVRMLAQGGEKEAIEALEKEAASWSEVDEVVYQRNVVEQIGRNINKFNLVLILFGVALLVISLILLNNTIRLTVFSKRYIINTMKLVGASKWFVMKPFLRSSVMQGLYAALIASAMFAGMVAGIKEGLTEIDFGPANMQVIWIVAGMFLSGVLISLLFTIFAVNKFVNMRTNAIYLY